MADNGTNNANESRGSAGFVPLFKAKGRPSQLSVGDMNALVKAIWPWQGLRVSDGLKLTRGDYGNVLDLSPALIDLARKLSAGGSGVFASGSATQYRVKSVQGDYLTCRTWDGTTEGSDDVYIAKPFKLRHSITSAVLDGATVNYTYASLANNLDGTRTATPTSGSAETELVVPRWLANDLIYAVQSNATGVSVGGNALTMVDINADGRAWVKKY